jgi:O-methyltransferase
VAIILDDYGWWGYSAQKIAIDPILESYDLNVLELPTGQAVILKR